MFTSAILKIIIMDGHKEGLVGAKYDAHKLGYDAIAFNGNIYVKVHNKHCESRWTQTPFTIEDFKVR